MKGNLLLFVSLLTGILVGMTGVTPHWLLNPQLPMLLLELLIVQVGMGIGSMEHLDRLFAGFRWEMLLRCCRCLPLLEPCCLPPRRCCCSVVIR